MFLSLILGTALGGINGLLITKGKMAPFIASLATMTIYRGLTLVYTDGNPITGIGDSFIFKYIGRGYLFGIPFPAILMVVSFVILYVVLHKMIFVIIIFVICGNDIASYIAVINNDRIKIVVYAISILMASLAGIIIISRLISAQPTASTAYKMFVIASVV